MADPHYATVSNDPDLDEDRLDELEDLLDEYVYGVGSVDVTEADIEGKDDNPWLKLGGYAEFGPVVRKDRFEPINEKGDRDYFTDTRHHEDDTVEFCQRLAEYLEEALVIRTISHTKLRYPAAASQWRVDPDGTVTQWWFADGEIRKSTWSLEIDDSDEGWRTSTPDTVSVERDLLEDIAASVATIRENRGEDGVKVSFALDDIEARLRELPDDLLDEPQTVPQ